MAMQLLASRIAPLVDRVHFSNFKSQILFQRRNSLLWPASGR
jgi:hypothetical protein